LNEAERIFREMRDNNITPTVINYNTLISGYADIPDPVKCESLLEEIDALKQILDGISNMYYAAQGQRMNKIMKVLTVISAIFIPLTFIAGVYGMNFENMPELKWSLGYFAIISLMVTLAAALFFYFWKKKWFD
jgi:magnesium transporter